MKIGVITGISRNDGGLFYAGSSLYREVYGQSVDVGIFGAGGSFSKEDRGSWGNLAVRPYQSIGPMGLPAGLRKYLRAFNADLLHQHGLWLLNQYEVLHWQRRCNRPVVISPHGMLDPWALANSAWKKKLVGKLFANESLAKATCIHALCRSEVDSIRTYGLDNPVAMIPNGVELPDIGGQRSEVRGQEGKKQLLFLGRIHPKKGLAELLHAWAKAKSQKPEAFSDWQLLIAGWDDGGHEAGLKALVNELDLGGSVSFIGSKYGKEKERLLRSVDAFVLPSFSEGLPMSVLEAWSFQLPVVMTDFCNLPEGFEADAGIRVEPRPESISQGLEKLAALSDAELQSMGSKGRRLVEEKFTWPRIAENMYKVYEWCLTGENPPACMEFFNG